MGTATAKTSKASQVMAHYNIRHASDYSTLLVYLQSVKHNSAICDRCIEPIHGEWFRCANCDADLCEDCEQVGVHDARHVFLVFKSTIDMQKFRRVRSIPLTLMTEVGD